MDILADRSQTVRRIRSSLSLVQEHSLPGLSDAFGAVNYTPYKLTDKDYIVLRNDTLVDPRGYRTGFGGTYFEHTLGWVHHFTIG